EDERDLAEEVAGAEGRELPPALADVRGAADEDAELPAPLPFLCQHTTRRQVDLVRQGRDPRDLPLGATGEEGNRGNQLELVVPAQHAADASHATPRCGEVAAWPSRHRNENFASISVKAYGVFTSVA